MFGCLRAYHVPGDVSFFCFYISRSNCHVHYIAQTSFRNNLDYLITILRDIEFEGTDYKIMGNICILGCMNVLAKES